MQGAISPNDFRLNSASLASGVRLRGQMCLLCVISCHSPSLYYYLYINVIFNGQYFNMYNTLDCPVNLLETARAERVCCKLKRLFSSQGISSWPWAGSCSLSMSLGHFKLKYLNKGLGFQGILVWSRSESPWGVLAHILVPVPSTRRDSLQLSLVCERDGHCVVPLQERAFQTQDFSFFHLSVYSTWTHKGSCCSLELVPRGRVSLSSFCYHPSP